MSDETDELIARVAASLSPLPAVDESLKAGVLVAIAAEREREQESARRRLSGAGWRLGIMGAFAAAALVAVVWMPSRVRNETAAAADSAALLASAPQTGAAAALAANEAAGAATAALPVQLVFHAPAATRVRVVGDFTGWDAGAAAMTRDPASGLWSVTVAVRPGRHVYAFLVDDTVWVRDPRAAVAADADFGRPGSVLLVGRP